MLPYLRTPIEYLKGVGPAKADLLKKELLLFTYGDLLQHYPFRYVDRTKFQKVREVLDESTYYQLRGRICSVQVVGDARKQRLVAVFKDDSAKTDLVWFQGVKWLKDSIKVDAEYVIFGKANYFNGNFNFSHPEIVSVEEFFKADTIGLRPVYSSTEKLKTRGFDSRGILRLVQAVLAALPKEIPESLSEELLGEWKLPGSRETLLNVHFPLNEAVLNRALFRLKLEELFYLQLKLLVQKVLKEEKNTGIVLSSIGDIFNTFFKEKLPFELTGAQKRVLKQIRQDVLSGKQMNRLVQGDVGSGKTIVALMSMLMAIDNGYQAALMAPTEILAQQHYTSIRELLKDMNLEVALLTGSTGVKDRRAIHEKLLNGDLHLVIGTHALIEDNIQFRKVGMVVIDEQHRFGVAQRAKLWHKGEVMPHILVMTATPIPRTLAMTLYGDLDSSVIDELPPGRKPIRTLHYFENSRSKLFGFMREQIALGRQVYVVYPLIKESEKLDYTHLMDGYESLSRAFPLPDYKISVVHGQMKAKDKDYEMQRFVKGETQIMVATSVIEVGVNVPNASVMIIESAERFGLSQLHQLRGRVGRGAEQSYCILMTDYKLSKESRLRMEAMVSTNDGFEIADLDLKMRGPGDLAGTQQSGILDLKMADIARDGAILELARSKAQEMLKEDPHLEMPKNRVVRAILSQKIKDAGDWSKIS